MKTKYNWEKCPSVTTGGKAYFYYLAPDCANKRFAFWITWDRFKKHYSFNNGKQTFLSRVKLNTVMKAAENWLDKQSVGAN